MNGELFVYKIWQICEAKNIPKGKFYKDVGITAPTMSAYKRGKATPTLDTLFLIANYLDVDVSYLLSDVYAPEKEKEPASQLESELDSALVKLLCSLTPTELAQVQAYAAGLITARKA